MDAFPILRTERLLLRQFVDDDIEQVFKGLSNPNVIRYYGVNYPTLEATKQQKAWFTNIYKLKTGIWCAICDNSSAELLGALGFNDINLTNQKAEIGFWILPEFWGKGFVQEAAIKIIDFAFTNLDMHRIEGFVETENRNSKRLMKKLNFIHEGTMRECELKNGNRISLEVFSRLKTDG